MYIYNIYLTHIYIYYTISIYTNAIICREPDGDTRRDASDSEAHVGRMCPTATTLGPGLAESRWSGLISWRQHQSWVS